MNYEYHSCIAPYVKVYLERQKPLVSYYAYAHYCSILQHLDHFLAREGCVDCNVEESVILNWVSSIGRKDSTIAAYCYTVRSFFNFLSGYGYHPFPPPGRKVPNDYIAYDFTDEEIRTIFLIADSYPLSGIRKYPLIRYELPMLLRILYGCGLRLGEAAALKLCDIDFGKGILHLRKTKAKEGRFVPMDNSLTEILAEYCVSMGVTTEPEAYIFPGHNASEHVPIYTLRHHFSRILKAADISLPGRKTSERGPCLHCFRHSFAHRSFKKGASGGWPLNDQIPWLSIYLGHASLAETEKYLKFNCDIYDDGICSFEDFAAAIFPEVNFND